MARLRNPRHEIFATEYAGGKNCQNAYRLAGFKPHRGNSRRLLRDPLVQARIAEISERAFELAELSLTRLLIEAGRIALANHAEFYGPDGFTLRNIKELPHTLQSAFAGIKFTADGRPQLEVHDKNAALFTLIKHYGGLPEPDPGERTVNFNFFDQLSLDDQQALADALQALPGRSEEAVSAPAGERREGPATP